MPISLYVSKQEGHATGLQLILVEKNPEKTHYVGIKNRARMLYKIAATNTVSTRAAAACTSSQAQLGNHEQDCVSIGEKSQRTEMPGDGENILKFMSHQKQMSLPYIMYADYADDRKTSWARQIANQTLCGYCYMVVRSN
jgi:hypothetical protein